MDGERITNDDHRRVGQRTYRAVVERFAPGSGPDDASTDLAGHEAWFDSLAEAGAWVDDQSVSPLDGRVEEHVWQETISVDREANRVVYDATRHPTGRFLDRIYYYRSPDEDDPQARWSFVDTDNEPGRFNPDVWPADETLWEYGPGIVGSSFNGAPTFADLATARRELVEALRAAWRLCELLRDPFDVGVPTGQNVPELLRAALEVVAAEVGGVDELVKHRPGSWEADHVRSLAVILTGWS